MTLFRVNIDGKANVTCYTRDPDVNEHGHLKFVDMDGRMRMVSGASEWTVTEVTENMIQASPRLRELVEDAEVIA